MLALEIQLESVPHRVDERCDTDDRIHMRASWLDSSGECSAPSQINPSNGNDIAWNGGRAISRYIQVLKDSKTTSKASLGPLEHKGQFLAVRKWRLRQEVNQNRQKAFLTPCKFVASLDSNFIRCPSTFTSTLYLDLAKMYHANAKRTRVAD